jgi:mRNA-degrading endonuclease RelE of RelBE toxin-antitoxin system
MCPDIAAAVESLRHTGRPDLRQLIAAARLDGPAPAAVPEAVEPYRWFLTRIANGIRLTSAGWLPPAVVVETMQHLGRDAGWIGKGNREDLTRPVAELRETARRLGLVRVHRGELRCTDAGRRLRADPAGLWAHVAGRLPVAAHDPERFATVVWLLAVAAGRSADGQHLVADVMTSCGWARSSGEPLDSTDAFGAIVDTWRVFDCLGLTQWRRDVGGELLPAGVALAQASLVADEPAPRRAVRPVPSFELEVTLHDVEPRVWRRIVVPQSVPLRRLHDLLQAAMGWDDGHLYLFVIDGRRYGDLEDIDDIGDLGTRLADVAGPGAVFRYDYDFGDGWEHDIRVVGTTTSEGPHCLDGARVCPPEDCGGPPATSTCWRYWPTTAIPSTRISSTGSAATSTPRHSTSKPPTRPCARPRAAAVRRSQQRLCWAVSIDPVHVQDVHMHGGSRGEERVRRPSRTRVRDRGRPRHPRAGLDQPAWSPRGRGRRCRPAGTTAGAGRGHDRHPRRRGGAGRDAEDERRARPLAAGQGGPRPGVTYAIRVAPAAVRQLRKLDPAGRRRVQAAIDLLAEEPRPPAARQLVGGAGEWRVRTGDFRIIYEIHDREIVVLVVKVGHPRDVDERR